MSKVKKGLTPQEQKAVAGLILGKTKRQAIKDSYNCRSLKVADEIGQKVFNRDRVVKELELYRNKEREVLLPLATQRYEDILRSQPKNKPNWETIRKASSEVVGRNTDEKTGGLTIDQYNFISKFINFNASGIKKPKINNQRSPIEVIEERGSLLEEGNENSEEKDINGGNDNNSNAQPQ